jgi:hypothetical protein
VAYVRCPHAPADLPEIAAGESGLAGENGEGLVLEERQDLPLKHGRVGRPAVVGGFPFFEFALPS